MLKPETRAELWYLRLMCFYLSRVGQRTRRRVLGYLNARYGEQP